MKKNILLLAIFLISLVKIEAQTNEQAINDCFISFKKSFAEKDGKKAYTLIDNKSRIYLDTLLNSIRYGDSLSVNKMDPIDKLLLFCIRSLVEDSILKSIDSKDLFDYLIKKDLFGTYDFVEICEITINSNQAHAKIVDTDPVSYLIFNRENNNWKYYINSVFEIEKEKLKSILADNKMNETDFIIGRVEPMTGKSFDKNLWNAPLRR